MSDWPTSSVYSSATGVLASNCLGSATLEVSEIIEATWATSRVCVALIVLYVPVIVAQPLTVTGMGWVNGAYSTPANIDCGIVDNEGTLMCHTGSTAQSGASAIQTVNAGTGSMVNTNLNPGQYFLAIEADSVNGFIFTTSGGAAIMWRTCGCRQATTGALGIPTSAPTWAAYAQGSAPLISANAHATAF